MPMLMLRYDMRLPDFAETPRSVMYRAAIDQCAWAEQHGFSAAGIAHQRPANLMMSPRPKVCLTLHQMLLGCSVLQWHWRERQR